MPSSINLIIIHPRELLRLGLLSVFKGEAGVSVVAYGSTGKDAGGLIKQHRPDVLLLFDQMDDQDSFDLAKQLKESNPDLKIVMLGVQDNQTYMARAAAAGVQDYLFEGSTGRQVLDTIKNVASGMSPSDSSSYGKALASMLDCRSSPSVDLTPREPKALRHMGYGLYSDEIFPDDPLTDGSLPGEVMILTADEQRRLFEKAGIPLGGGERSTPPQEETLTSCVSQWESQSQHDIADCEGTIPMAVKTTFAFDDDEPSFRQIVKWVTEPNSFDSSGLPKLAAGEAQEFRPFLRPPTPILTLLDDGSMEQGEDVRIRQETLRIGRTSGDVRIPHDSVISGEHADIRCTPWQGGYQWHLHDLDSVNGTFAKTDEVVLHKDTVVILGSRRYRLEHKLRPDIVEDATFMYSDPPIPESMFPVLTEASARPGALEFDLRSDRLVIGRVGSGADIELDDPLLDERHAELKRLQDGSWTITSEGTRNGIWVSVSAVLLSPLCYFRCGDQRFRFMIP